MDMCEDEVELNKSRTDIAIEALAELASAPMCLPLKDWSRISSAILRAMRPTAPATAQKAAIDALAELASAPMRLPLEDWSRISSAISKAIEHCSK